MNNDQRLWNSAYSGRAARTMQAAFGCYTDHVLRPMPEPVDPWRNATRALYFVAILAVAVIAYLLKKETS